MTAARQLPTRDDRTAELETAKSRASDLAEIAAHRRRERDDARDVLRAQLDAMKAAKKRALGRLERAEHALDLIRDGQEQIDRGLAAYDTQPSEPAADERTEPHEDPARLRRQLADAHADCARYATERDEARAALADPLRKAAEHLRLLAADHAADSLGFGIEWAADALDAWAKTPDEQPVADPGSPSARAQEPGDPVGYEIVATRLHRDGLGALRSGDVVASVVSARPTLTEAIVELLRAVQAVRPGEAAQGDDLADQLAAEAAQYRWTPGQEG